MKKFGIKYLTALSAVLMAAITLIVFVFGLTFRHKLTANALSLEDIGKNTSLFYDDYDKNFEKYSNLLKSYNGFEDKEIEKLKVLTDFNGELFVDIECKPVGYFIINYETSVPFEYSATSVSPYADSEGTLIYGAPTYYYEVSKNTRSAYYVKDIMQKEDLVLDNDIINSFKTSNKRSVESLRKNRSNISTYAINDGNNLYIRNYKLISEIKDFDYNTIGDCTYIAAAIILYYNYVEFNNNFIDAQYVASNGFKIGLVNQLIDIGKQVNVGIDTDAYQIKKVMKKYTETRVPEATHYSMGLSTALNIDLCFKDDKPVMLSGKFENVSTGKGKVSHSIVAFGRSETILGASKMRYYHVNYGWGGYTNVTIMDNIFKNPIGCIYNLNPEG